MNLQAFIQTLKSELDGWARSAGGELVVATDPLEPYVVLAGGLRNTFVAILVLDGSDQMNVEQHPHGMEQKKIQIYLGHPLDLRAERDAWLYKDDISRRSLLNLLDSLRDHVFTIVLANGENRDDGFAHNLGTEAATLPNGIPLRAYKITVSWPTSIEVDESQYRYPVSPAGAEPGSKPVGTAKKE